MKRLLALFILVAMLAVALPGAAAAQDAGKTACKQGDWKELVRQDGTSFANQGSCVSYVARGGTPMVPVAPVANALEAQCRDDGGTYSEPDGDLMCAWTGNVPYAGDEDMSAVYSPICIGLGGQGMSAIVSGSNGDFRCEFPTSSG